MLRTSRVLRSKSQNNAQLAEEKAKSDALFASIGDGVIALDESGRVQRVNQIALDLLGFAEEELVGQWFPKVIIAEDANGTTISGIDRPIAQTLLLGKPVSARFWYRKKDGESLPVAVTASPIMLDDKPAGAIEVFRDITKEAEVDRMKSEFISLASHQLRTPATAVKQFIGLIREGYAETPEKTEQFLTAAYNSNEDQLAIIDDILNVAKIDAGKLQLRLEPTDMAELTADITAQLSGQAKSKNQSLTYVKPAQPIELSVDIIKMKMVIGNLISNAIKYTPDGGTIDVQLISHPHNIEIRIKDNGIGIGKKDQAQLFKKFSRIENEYTIKVQGTGLGLYLVKGLVELHNGTIHLESAVNKGTCFIIKLPKEPR